VAGHRREDLQRVQGRKSAHDEGVVGSIAPNDGAAGSRADTGAR